MMMVLRRRHRDSAGPSPWAEELARLEELLRADPHGEWAWLWQLRLRILRFLDSQHRWRPRATRRWRPPWRPRAKPPRVARLTKPPPVEWRYQGAVREHV
ncbi:MAG: hypothetical protein ACYTGP_06255, partial [Planctomycetota bacterium]